MSGWKCPVCGKVLKTHGTRSSHMRIHNEINVTVSYPCSECGQMVDIPGRTAKEAQANAAKMNGLCESCLQNKI